MKRAALVMLALVCMFGVQPALADGFGIGPHAGYYRNRGSDDGDFLFGAAIRTKFLTILGAEASIDYRRESFADDAVTAQMWPIQVTGLIYPFTALYGAVGAGWYRTTYEFQTPGLENHTQKDFGWHLGAGLEIPLGGLSLTGDVRWVYLDTKFEELPESANRDTDFYVMSVGILFGL